MPVVLQVGSRGIAILLTRDLHHVFIGAEAQDQTSVRDLVYSVSHREDGLLTRCKEWTDIMAIRSLESERYKAKRIEEEEVYVYYRQVSK